MGAGASQARAQPLRLSADTPGLVLSLQPNEHMSLSFVLAAEHQQRMAAAATLGLYAYIAIQLCVKEGQVGQLQLHLPQQHVRHVTQLPQAATPASTTGITPQQLSFPAPTLVISPPTTHFDASTRLIASSNASPSATPQALVLHLLPIDCDAFRPASYPLTISNSSTKTLATLSASCHVDNPIALNAAMHTLQLDHHRLAWQLHAAQLHIRQLQHNLHSSHAQLQEKDQQASKAQELIEAKRARAVHRLFSNNQSFLLRSRFSEWRLEAHQQRSLRASSLQSVLSNGHQRCLATVWERWMAAVATQEADRWKAQLNDQKLKRARTMIAHHIAKSTTTVFHAWRQHVRHTRQRKRAILEAMLGKRELARQWKVWKHWTGKVLRKRTHITQQQLEEQREEREKERARHREEKERHEQEREARTKELEEKVASASKAAEKAAEERVLSASQTEAVTAARAAELVHKRVNAVMGRMLQGSLRTSFLAWRAQSRKAKQTRLDAVSLLLGKRSHTSIARAFRSWRAEARRTQQVKSDESAVQAAEEKRLAEYRAAEDKRQRSLAGMADAMSVKANRRQLVRSFEQWQRWSRERLQHRREAQRLVEQLCGAQQLQAAWCVWRQQISQAREEEKEDEYGYAKTLLATSRHQSLPQVAMSRTQPLSSSASRTARLSTSSTVLPSPSSSSHPAASRPSVLPVSSSAYRQLVSDHSSLLALYRRLFLLLQSLRGDVSRQWEAEAARLLQHTTCRCEQCAMRKTARAKGGAQLAWLRRYDQQIEGFRYVA